MQQEDGWLTTCVKVYGLNIDSIRLPGAAVALQPLPQSKRRQAKQNLTQTLAQRQGNRDIGVDAQQPPQSNQTGFLDSEARWHQKEDAARRLRQALQRNGGGD